MSATGLRLRAAVLPKRHNHESPEKSNAYCARNPALPTPTGSAIAARLNPNAGSSGSTRVGLAWSGRLCLGQGWRIRRMMSSPTSELSWKKRLARHSQIEQFSHFSHQSHRSSFWSLAIVCSCGVEETISIDVLEAPYLRVRPLANKAFWGDGLSPSSIGERCPIWDAISNFGRWLLKLKQQLGNSGSSSLETVGVFESCSRTSLVFKPSSIVAGFRLKPVAITAAHQRGALQV